MWRRENFLSREQFEKCIWDLSRVASGKLRDFIIDGVYGVSTRTTMAKTSKTLQLSSRVKLCKIKKININWEMLARLGPVGWCDWRSAPPIRCVFFLLLLKLIKLKLKAQRERETTTWKLKLAICKFQVSMEWRLCRNFHVEREKTAKRKANLTWFVVDIGKLCTSAAQWFCVFPLSSRDYWNISSRSLNEWKPKALWNLNFLFILPYFASFSVCLL